MKKKIIKLWGVGMIVVLMASLLLVGATPAAAGTQAYSPAGVPNPAPGGVPSNQILLNSDVAIIEVASDGTIFAVNSVPNPNVIYKSVDGGRSWVAQTVPFAANIVVADIVISPSYETDATIFALLNDTVLNTVTVTRSTNGGATYSPYAPAVNLVAAEIGTSLALEPTYVSGVGGVMVGTADTTGGLYGDVYTWNPVTFAWTPGLLAQDISSVAYSPNYPVDATLLAVGSVAGAAGTVLNTKVFTNAWNATFNQPTLEAAAKDLGTAGAIVSSSMAFPSDYNASIPLLNNFYIGINSAGAADDVFRVNGITTLTIGATDINMVAALTNNSINNVAYAGSYTAGTLYAGSAGSTAVYYSSNANAAVGIIWGTAIYAPTGATLAYVAVDPTTAGKIYVGTTGAGALDESAVSVSVDGGLNYYQYGLIDTAITAITDFQPLNATEWYMVTTGGGIEAESLWKTTDAGATYKRIFALVTNAQNAAVRLSPYFTTDMTMYFTEIGVTAAAPLLRLSQDGGNTWQQRNYPTALSAATQGPADLVVVDQFTAYVGDVNPGLLSAVYRTNNNGFYWAGQAVTGATGINDLALDVASGAVLAGSIAGTVYVSNDGATWIPLGAPGLASGNMVVAFDANYATNSYVYAGDSSGAGVGVYRFMVGSIGWFQIDNQIPAGKCAAITVTPDGALYAVDATPAVLAVPLVSPEMGGIIRALIPTSGSAVPPIPMAPAAQLLGITNGGLAATTVLGSIASVPGSNMLFSIAGAGIQTYTDTLTTAVPAVLSPSEGDILLAATAAVFISPVTNATGHQVQWNTRSDWLGTGATITTAGFPTYSSGALGAPNGSTIYFRVRVSAPVTGPWSTTMTFETQLSGAVLPNAPAIPGAQPAANGGVGVGLNPTFFWGGVIGATHYHFQLAADAGMTDPIIDYSGDDALGNVLALELTAITLDYNTTYYWKVMASSATSETSWSTVQGFTTMAEPAPPPPDPVTVTDAPDIIVTIPAPEPVPDITLVPPVEEPTAQGYIWAIIIIGAILVIAVIVLIVRTRRSV